MALRLPSWAQCAVVLAPSLLLLGACASPFTGEYVAAQVEKVANIPNPQLLEISGLAASHRTEGLLWAHNDSGDNAILHALGTDGRLQGRIKLRNIVARDWEDMCSFVLDGKPMLLVADTGDNRIERGDIKIHVLEEPEQSAFSSRPEAEVDVAWTIPFAYEDGPHDCESAAVDVSEGMIYLVTKREHPAGLYSLPLRPAGPAVARRIADIRFVPRPPPAMRPVKLPSWRYRDQATGLDITGSKAVLLTYGEAYLVEKAPGESWAAAFKRGAGKLPPHGLLQAEAVCFDRQGRSIFVASEKKKQPLKRYLLP